MFKDISFSYIKHLKMFSTHRKRSVIAIERRLKGWFFEDDKRLNKSIQKLKSLLKRTKIIKSITTQKT